MYVFVYGTLKHGHGLNQVLIQGGAKFLGGGYIDGIRLYSWGICPAAFPGSPDDRAWGEIYEVDAALLGVLDRIEASYEREQRTAVIMEGSVNLSPVTAWIYVGVIAPVGGAWIKDGVFRRIYREDI